MRDLAKETPLVAARNHALQLALRLAQAVADADLAAQEAYEAAHQCRLGERVDECDEALELAHNGGESDEIVDALYDACQRVGVPLPCRSRA